MPRSKTDYQALTTRQHATSALVDDPPLGHLQALVLKKLHDLYPDAYGFKVLETLSLDAGVWLDTPDVYASIRRLLAKELIRHTETRPQPGGPPVKIYKLEAAGRAALKATAAHYRAVADNLDDNG